MKIKVILSLFILIFLIHLASPGCKKSSVEPEIADTTKIAFTSLRDGNEEIYIMNIDGSEQTNLTNDPGDDMFPIFQP